MINIAIFATGNGDTTENLLTYFNKTQVLKNPSGYNIRATCVISNEEGEVIKRLRRFTGFTKHVTDRYIEIDKILTKENIHYIVLDNFSDIIPPNFCKKYKYRIINIHQSLLPKYSDIQGIAIQQSVIKNHDENAGISIYFVEEEQKKSVIYQNKTRVNEGETPEDILVRIQLLEEKFYAPIIEKTVLATYEKIFKK